MQKHLPVNEVKHFRVRLQDLRHLRLGTMTHNMRSMSVSLSFLILRDIERWRRLLFVVWNVCCLELCLNSVEH